MTRRRFAIATGAALLAAGTFGAASATADTDGAVPTVQIPASTAENRYIACAGVETVDVAVCVESPVRPIFDLLPGR